MTIQNTKRQHYVWRNYLKPWCNNGKIYCLREGEIFQANLMGIAQQRYFYRIEELSDHEIFTLKELLVNYQIPELQKSMNYWIDLYTYPYKYKDSLIKKGIDITNTERFKKWELNHIELMHSVIENDSVKYLNKLLNEDVSFYDVGESKADFNLFLMMQYYRTKKMRESFSGIEGKDLDINFERLSNIVSQLSAIAASFNMGLTEKEFKCHIIKNITAIPFITSDQPVINICANYKQLKLLKGWNEFQLYYPVGPYLAVKISNEEHLREQICEENVIRYNNLIYNAAHEQIYSKDRDYLRSFIK